MRKLKEFVKREMLVFFSYVSANRYCILLLSTKFALNECCEFDMMHAHKMRVLIHGTGQITRVLNIQKLFGVSFARLLEHLLIMFAFMMILIYGRKEK